MTVVVGLRVDVPGDGPDLRIDLLQETGLARPGGNITGLSSMDTDLSGKRLALLKEAVPTLSRVAVLWNTTDRAMTLRFEQLQGAA